MANPSGAIEAVKTLGAVLKAKKRIPNAFHGQATFFTDHDKWEYLESDHPRMCNACHDYNLMIFTGDRLRQEFPHLEVLDVNFINPQVHPNCACGLLRVFDLTTSRNEENVEAAEAQVSKLEPVQGYQPLDLDINIRVEMLAPMHVDAISNEGKELLYSKSEDEFLQRVSAMRYIGYIEEELYYQLLREYELNKQKQKTKNKIKID